MAPPVYSPAMSSVSRPAAAPASPALAALAARLGDERLLRPARHGAMLAMAVYVAGLAAGIVPLAVDAHAYWAADPLRPYHPVVLGDFDAYFYSPAFAQALWPLTRLPWPLFAAAWTILLGVALRVAAGRWFGLVVVVPLVAIDLAMGNIHVLIGLAVAAGFRWPATWAFVLLTKVTPGVGLLWFAVRREWRRLAIALGATAAVVVVSAVIRPAAWSEWIALVSGPTAGGNAIPVPLWVRVPAAAVLVAWGARTDRPWTVVVAAWLALPALWWNGAAVLVGLVPLLDRPPRSPGPPAPGPARSAAERPRA